MQALSRKKLIVSIVIPLAFLIIIFVFLNYYLANRIAPNVRIGNLSLSNKKTDDARLFLTSELSAFEKTPLTFWVEGAEVQSDLETLGITIDEDKTLELITKIGKSPDAWDNIFFWLESPFVTRQISPQYSLDISKFKEATDSMFSKYEKKPQDATIIFNNGNFKIQQDQVSVVINKGKLAHDAKEKIRNLSNSPINL